MNRRHCANVSAEVDDSPTALLELAIDFAERVADRHAAGGTGDVDSKSSSTDPVTQVDTDSEQMITEAIRATRPNDGIFGEEGIDVTGTSGFRWIIDPLDGTVNYLYGFAAHAVSIAVEQTSQGETTTIVGVVHDTALGNVYSAAAGNGAWVHRGEQLPRPLRANDVSDPGHALLATGFGYDPEVRRAQGKTIAQLLPQVRDIRRAGSAALDMCFVASGSVDAYYETGPHLWDVAAGSLIVAEAGGRVTYDPDRRRVIAAGRYLYDPLEDLIVAAENRG